VRFSRCSITTWDWARKRSNTSDVIHRPRSVAVVAVDLRIPCPCRERKPGTSHPPIPTTSTVGRAGLLPETTSKAFGAADAAVALRIVAPRRTQWRSPSAQRRARRPLPGQDSPHRMSPKPTSSLVIIRCRLGFALDRLDASFCPKCHPGKKPAPGHTSCLIRGIFPH
jgi:hypothetical protein